jgi:alpha-D-xyloside xylohydrolase
MAESLRGGLSFGLGGFGFWSHDIGGFENSSTPDVYKRWIAFGMLSSHSRLHGSGSYRVPWLYDEEAVQVLRFFTRQKCRLMPYLYATAKQATESGLPMMRAMILEFEDDPACDYLERQYLLGDSLLIAPVFSENGSVSFYLPKGTWTNFLTGEQVEDGIWRHEQHGYMSLPMYVQNNTIVALGQQENRPDYDYADGVELHMFALQPDDHAHTQVYNQQGQPELSIYADHQGQIITLHTEGAGKPWSVVLRNISVLTFVEGATYEQTEQGIRLIPQTGVDTLKIALSEHKR